MKTVDDLPSGPGAIDLLDLLRQLERRDRTKPRVGESGTISEDIVALGQVPFVEHPDSNVASIAELGDGRTRVECRFLGLLGPQGALPLHTTYEAAHWANMRDAAFARFLDIFNNRFLQLFFRTWANARPAVQADRPADNQFATYLGAMVGIGTPAQRRRDRLPDFSKLAVAGLLSPAVKSASRLENLLAWLFEAKVMVRQFVGVWLPIEPHEQAALAPASCKLGDNSIIGKTAFSLQDKFRVRIKVADLDAFERFLPDGAFFELMSDAIYFYLGDTFIYDVEIGIPEVKTRPVQLGGFGRLGWTSWLISQGMVGRETVRWDCRFHPSRSTTATA
jgi:type VI secretion system protein ImpH